jgi:membrane glycosyltransferase
MIGRDRFVWAARLLLAVLVLGSTGLGASLMSQVVAAQRMSLTGLGCLALFTLSFFWLSLGFWNAVFGFVSILAGARARPAEAGTLQERIATAMPIYNEDPDRVSAGVEATLTELARLEDGRQFDVFLLSDTTDPAIAEEETRLVAALRARYRHGSALFYRRRSRNLGRKSGNVADFVRRWGGRYDHMIVFDADSVMSGPTMDRLARMMAANPEAGIIQTVPLPANRRTGFARMLQFACRVYGPVQAAGFACWTGDDSNYFGHNAIIRLAAFARHCVLPHLPGKPPLGGEILSHDFVEAALMRGAGYRVLLATELDGSWEETPSNVIDYAGRDRRWCQGNLQHGRLLGMPGLRLMGRAHLTMGIASYLLAPIWLAFLAVSSADAIQRALIGPVYFKPGFNLFPDWPVATDFQIDLLLAMTLAALFLPKLLGLVLVLADRKARRACGGALALIGSALAETLISMLLAPIMMMFQVSFVTATYLGRSISWHAQARGDRGISWSEAARRHAGQTLTGAIWAVIVAILAPDFVWWLAPIWSGLLLAIPLSVLSSRDSVGVALARYGLFLTPAETDPPPELAVLRHALATGREVARFNPMLDLLPTIPPEHGLPMAHPELAEAS